MAIEIVTLTISVLALVVSILVFVDSRSKTKILKEQNEDNRKKTEIMENQLKLLQAQSESKQYVRETFEIIENIQGKIAKLNTAKYDWGNFDKLASQRFLEMSHDSGSPTINWKVRPYSIFRKSIGESYLQTDAKTFEAFKAIFETNVPKAETDFIISFLSDPKIESSDEKMITTILVKDYVKDIYSLKLILDELKKMEKVINMYDSSLVSDIEEVYGRILRCLFSVMGKDYVLEISSKIKAKELPNHLLTFICFNTWEECVKDLKEKHNLRLFDIKRRLSETV